MSQQFPFPIDAELTAVAITYTNEEYIADKVLPRVPVGKSAFEWWEYDAKESFTVPDTKVGRKSKPNEVEFSAIKKTDSTEDFALDAPVPVSDIENAPNGHNPRTHASKTTTNLILLDREIRTANTVFNEDNYSFKDTLTGNEQWSDKTNSNPAINIIEALDKPLIRPNIGVLGSQVATALRTHPKIIAAYNGNASTDGLVPLGFLEDYFEVKLFVGRSRFNQAKKGKNSMSLARVWGNHAAFIYSKELDAISEGEITWGFTAQFGSRLAWDYFDKDRGMKGSQVIRVGESVKELCCAKDAGYFFKNAIAS